MEQKKTICSIDLFKFFAAILVVAIHTHPYEGSRVDYFFTCFCRIAVPFFFVASSFFFFRRNNPDLKSYVKRLGMLYVLWFILELPVVYKRFFVEFDHSFPFQVVNFFRCLIFSNTWWASWFIMASIIAVSIIYILNKRYKFSNKTLFILAGGGYFISLISSSYSGLLDSFLNDGLKCYHKAFSLCFCPANSFIIALIYVVIGKIIAEKGNNIDLNKYKLCLVCIIVLMIGAIEITVMEWSVFVNDAWLFLPFLAYFGFILLLTIDLKFKPNTTKWMRNLSILIYILHSVFQHFNSLFGIKNGMLMFLLTALECLCFSGLFIFLSEKFAILKKFY